MPRSNKSPLQSNLNEIENHLICSHCHHLLIEPKFTNCGHRYCSNCLQNILRNNDKSVCSANDCDEKLTKDKIYSDIPIENELKHLTQINCHNTSKGCQWKGNYLSYKDHIQTCTYEKLQCDYCLMNISNRDAYEKHNQTCPKALISCPLKNFGCEIDISREKLPEHVVSSSIEHLQMLSDQMKSFQNQIATIYSKIMSISSSVPISTINDNSEIKYLQNQIVKQSDLIERLNNEQKSIQSKFLKREQDLSRACVALQLNKGDLCHLQKEYELSKTYTNNDGTYLWCIDNIQELYINAKNSTQPIFITSPPFYTSKYGYKISLKLYLNGDKTVQNTYLSLYITIMRHEYDTLLNWPFKYPITLCLYDRSSKQDHVVHTVTPDLNSECFQQPKMDSNKSGGIPEFCPLWKLFDKQFGYVSANKIYIKAFVDFHIYPPKVWPYWTKLQSHGLPINVEHIKLNEFLHNQK